MSSAVRADGMLAGWVGFSSMVSPSRPFRTSSFKDSTIDARKAGSRLRSGVLVHSIWRGPAGLRACTKGNYLSKIIQCLRE